MSNVRDINKPRKGRYITLPRKGAETPKKKFDIVPEVLQYRLPAGVFSLLPEEHKKAFVPAIDGSWWLGCSASVNLTKLMKAIRTTESKLKL